MKSKREIVRSFTLAIVAGAMGMGSGQAAPAAEKGRLGPALLGAASRGDTAAVKRLLARGADPNARTFRKGSGGSPPAWPVSAASRSTPASRRRKPSECSGSWPSGAPSSRRRRQTRPC